MPVAPALIQAAKTAWAAYASTCRFSGSTEQRRFAYQAARAAEHRLWVAEGTGAARA